MFYLLEDNRIYDSMDIRYFDLCERFDFLLEVIDEIVIKNLGKIKNQSENVYDFIDKSLDLVKVDGQIMMAKYINGDITKISGITAIYKPNEKGDYIKVWEKKEDE